MNTRIRRFAWSIFLPLASLFSPVAALQLPNPPADSAQESQVNTLLAQANYLAQTENDSRKALALYSEALSLEGPNSEILWLISRSYLDIGSQMPASTDEEKAVQLSMYEKALEFASRSVDANPGNSISYTFRAMALSHIAPYKGFWESMSLMKDVRSDLEKSLELDASNHLAHFVYGGAHLKVIEKPWLIRWPLGMGWGSREEALSHFIEAVNLRWDVVKYRLACANLHVEEENFDLARAHLTLIPYLDPQNRGDVVLRSKALEILKDLPDEN